MERPVRVCIIHDHQLFSDVVTALLQQEEAISLMEPAPHLGGIGLTDHSTPFDVVLIDTTTVRMNTVHVMREIKRTCPGVKVIVLGLEYLEEDVLRFIEAGASGYVLKLAFRSGSTTAGRESDDSLAFGKSRRSRRLRLATFIA